MILYPPHRFDLNEWFVLFSLLAVIVAVVLLPRRFSPVLTAFVLLFNVFLGQTVDFLIGAPPYDLYDTNDRDKYEYMDSVLYLFTYPLDAYVMLTIYERLEWKGFPRILYIGGWALMTMCLEWVSDSAHVFTYKRWNLLYSFFVYIGVFTLNVIMLHWQNACFTARSRHRRKNPCRVLSKRGGLQFFGAALASQAAYRIALKRVAEIQDPILSPNLPYRTSFAENRHVKIKLVLYFRAIADMPTGRLEHFRYFTTYGSLLTADFC